MPEATGGGDRLPVRPAEILEDGSSVNSSRWATRPPWRAPSSPWPTTARAASTLPTSAPQRAADFSLERHCRNVADLFQPLLGKQALDRVGART